MLGNSHRQPQPLPPLGTDGPFYVQLRECKDEPTTGSGDLCKGGEHRVPHTDTGLPPLLQSSRGRRLRLAWECWGSRVSRGGEHSLRTR